MNLNQPVFICGALRSGSTLLHLMLDHHPNVKNPGEFDFMFDLVNDLNGFPDAQAYHEFLDKSRIFKSKRLNIDKSLGFKELIGSFATQLKEQDKVLALNVHRNFNRIPALFPDAKYVHLLRDPRDVARSSKEMGWRGNVFYGVDHWINTEQSWIKLEKTLKPEQFTTVHFEQLIENPETVLAELCRFLGLKYDTAMLDYHLHSSYKKPDKTLVQQWRQKLSEREIQLVEVKADHLMTQNGYPLSGLPCARIGVLEKLQLILQNKLFRVTFGIKKYGISLYVLEKLTQFTGLKQWHKALFLRKEDINRRHLK